MVVFSNFLVVYFGLNYSSLFGVILVSSRRRIYIYIYTPIYIYALNIYIYIHTYNIYIYILCYG